MVAIRSFSLIGLSSLDHVYLCVFGYLWFLQIRFVDKNTQYKLILQSTLHTDVTSTALRTKRWRLHQMDLMCGGDKAQVWAFIASRLKRDFPDVKLCDMSKGGDFKLAVLSLVRQLNCTEDNYVDLKHWLKSLYKIVLPSWVTLREERLECCPPVSKDGVTGHSATLQATLDITADR